MTVYWPAVNPVVTEEAGTRGGTHSGIDLKARRGDPVLAPFDGVAVYVGGDGASGRLWLGDGWLYPNGASRTVDIRRDDGLISRVGHLEGYAIRQGDRVTAGQTVGYAGDSGYSTGVHIHWELRWDRAWSGGQWINPRLLNPQIYQEDDMFNDDDRAKLTETYSRLRNMEGAAERRNRKLDIIIARARQIYDGIFKQSKTSRGEHAGLLSMTNAIYDSQFKEEETSRGTPGGVLVTLSIVVDRLSAIERHLGIGTDEGVADAPSTSNES